MARKKYDVISPDGFSIHREDTYTSRKAARVAFNEWKERYRSQGYYSSARYGRIPLDELENYCQLYKDGTWCAIPTMN